MQYYGGRLGCFVIAAGDVERDRRANTERCRGESLVWMVAQEEAQQKDEVVLE